MTRFDLVSPRKGKDDKTRWFKVGAAFPRDKGGFQLVFDALPLPDADGRVTLMMWEAEAKADRQEAPRRDAPPAQRRDMDDEIPF